MHPERAQHDRHAGQRRPAGLEPEDEGDADHRLSEDRQVGESRRQAEGFEKADRAGETEDGELQIGPVGQEENAHGDTQKGDALGREVLVNRLVHCGAPSQKRLRPTDAMEDALCTCALLVKGLQY